MTAGARFAELRRLFEQVCDLPEPARREFWNNTGADTALVAEVEALLASETGSLQRASVPVAALLEAMPETELDEGDRIGAWRLTRKLASGGMGTVYRAERADGHFEQQAAIKLLRGFPTTESLARLAAERQTLAGLQHPHIARLIDGGATPSGQPYLVMEFVDGVPIDVWCRAARLDLRARLRLFRNVCRAVAFAHQRLIVHCDIKPSNVLVRPDGSPVLLDFGIARALDRTRESIERDAWFTPGYASPEQIAGQAVTVASDVYSLGLILFEILTERKARAEADDLTITQLGRAQARPSDLAIAADCPWRRSLRGDLDAIVLRATSERAALRYASADALAEDIERHLDLKPVAAREQTLVYRYGRLARRRWPLFAGAALVLLMGGGFGWRIVTERDRALSAEREARLQAETAQQVSDFLVSVFQYANPEKNPGRREITAREMLDEGSRRIGTELAAQPAVRAKLSDVLGRAYWMLGQPKQAMDMYSQAIALWQDAAVAQPLAAADSLSKLAVLQTNNSYDAVAVETARASFALRAARLPPDDPALADSYNTLGLALSNTGKFDEAAQNYERSLDIRRRVLGPKSDQVATTLHNMGIMYGDQGHNDKALEVLGEALAMKRATFGGDRFPTVLSTLENYAKVLSRVGRTDEAIPLLQRVLELHRELDGGESMNASVAYNEVGSALHDAGRYEEAATNYTQAMEIDAKLVGREHPTYVKPLNNLASAYEDMGDYARAEPLFRESLAIRTKILGADDPMVARAEYNLARVLTKAGRLDEAQPLLESAYAKRRAKYGDANQETAQSLLLQAELSRRRGDMERVTKSLAAYDATVPRPTPLMNAHRARLQGEIEFAAGRIDAALTAFAQAQQTMIAAWGESNPLTAEFVLERADAELRAGRVAEAKRWLDVARPVLERAMAKVAPVRARIAALAVRIAAAPKAAPA